MNVANHLDVEYLSQPGRPSGVYLVFHGAPLGRVHAGPFKSFREADREMAKLRREQAAHDGLACWKRTR